LKDNTLRYFNISLFQQNLLHWYSLNKRDLPWRKDQDPYKIWVSEIMLQQTKVDTVIPYFNRFMMKYPTVFDLAEADEQSVLKEWEGLGYYSRAKNLHHAVKEVVSVYNGEVPNDFKQLVSLKGIGPYTRGAILSIAFNQAEPAVDGNVMRVLSRVLKIEKNIANQQVKKYFEYITKELISTGDPASFNQGLMELGALICKPKAPLCDLCPVKESCRAQKEGIQEQLPIKTKAKKQKTFKYIALLITDEKENIIIEKRPSKGLLANLWQFPMIPLDEVSEDNQEKWLQKSYGLSVDIKEEKGVLKHVFSHIIWDVHIYTAKLHAENETSKQLRKVALSELEDYPFPVSHLNMMKFL